ncbi:MAG: hypothetical protein B6244_03540 [Candidatus Cloacimonetes bacterium 4572_55]|nr:MAG: hypothetical protein B6244_03540 [Candidatus Cloacimonetes bacterium 4572_55]
MFDLTFLNSAFLIGILGALLPLLIHLLNRRRIKVILFSTLKYLLPLQKKQMRRIRIREIILLIIRMLIIGFLALALARPAFKGSSGGSVSAHTATSVFIVLDDSYSMAYESAGGTIFHKARQKTFSLIEFLNESDDANLIFSSNPDQPIFDEPTHNFSLLQELVDKKQVSAAKGNLIAAINKATQLADKSINLNKEIYLITDMQAVGWDTAGVALPTIQDPTRLFIIDMGEKRRRNLYVENVDYKNQLLFANKPIRFASAIFNGTNEKVDNQLLQIFLNGIKKSQVGVSIAPNSYGQGTVSVTFPETKDYSGFVELPDDALMIDNRRYFTTNIKGEVKALILIDEITDEQKNGFFITTGLNPLDSNETRIIPVLKEKAALGNLRLSDYQVIILSNVSSLNQGELSLLSAFVERGGGLMCVLGSQCDVRFYNDSFLPIFSPAKIKSLRGAEQNTGDKRAFFSWDKIDYEHYVFQIFNEKENSFLSLRSYFSYELLPEEGSNVLVSYNNRMPALLTHSLGQGKVALLSSSLDNDWNNLPIRSVFVPFIHRMVQFLGLSDYQGQTLHVGEPAAREVENIPYGAKIVCIKPGDDVVEVTPESKEGRNILRLPDTNAPGIYTWRVGGEIVGQFAVNVDVEESDLFRIENDKVIDLFPDQNVTLLTGSDSLKDQAMQARYGRELWKFFLWFVFLLLITEMLIAWWIGYEKKLEVAPAAI